MEWFQCQAVQFRLRVQLHLRSALPFQRQVEQPPMQQPSLEVPFQALRQPPALLFQAQAQLQAQLQVPPALSPQAQPSRVRALQCPHQVALSQPLAPQSPAQQHRARPFQDQPSLPRVAFPLRVLQPQGHWVPRAALFLEPLCQALQSLPLD